MFSDSLSQYIQQDEPLASRCWLKIGGSASYYAEASDMEVLKALCTEAHRLDIPVKILGGGSNLLIRPGSVDALVLRLVGEFQSTTIRENHLIAGSAASLSDVISKAAEHGLSGLEHLAGIPGTIGGAVVCNSGVKNDDIGSHVLQVHAIDREGNLHTLNRDALKFSFRRSNLEDVVVTGVEFALERLDPQEVTRRLQANWIVKKAAQPASGARVGKLFVEPGGSRIVDLLDAVGMRSTGEGGAAMITQFPGFVQVNENATANDVLALSNRIARAVEVQSGIRLRSQLRIW